MPDQTVKNGAPAEPASFGDVTESASGLAHDLITLAELQVRLLYLDVREATRRSAASLIILAAMLGLSLSAIPVVLMGLSELLGTAAGWKLGVAKLVVGGAAVVLGAWTGWIGLRRLRNVTSAFGRTQQELEDNLAFIKSLVSSPPKPNGRWPSRW